MAACAASSFATGATASSSWPQEGWHVSNVLGPPVRDRASAIGATDYSCHDGPGVWSPATGGADMEWLRLTFPAPMRATKLEVYEAYVNGSLASIEYEDVSGGRHTVWSSPPSIDATLCGGAFELTHPSPTTYDVAAVWLFTAAEGYEEIDAVRLTGTAPACWPPLPPRRRRRRYPTRCRSREPPPPPPPWWMPDLTAGELTNLTTFGAGGLGAILAFWYAAIACMCCSVKEGLIRGLCWSDPRPRAATRGARPPRRRLPRRWGRGEAG